MNENNGAAKWQLAFWIITVFCFVGFTTEGSAIITNDRLRQSEDQIMEKQINKQYQEIIQRLTRIETKVQVRIPIEE